jgi:hypothetical protein
MKRRVSVSRSGLIQGWVAVSGNLLLQPVNAPATAITAPPPARRIKDRRLVIAQAPSSEDFAEVFLKLIGCILFSKLIDQHQNF